MSGLEVIGTVASIAQLAGTAYSLSKTLYELGDAITNASEDIRSLAHDLSLFSQSLVQLQRLLEVNKGAYNLDIYILVKHIIRECSIIHDKIAKLIRKLGKDGMKARFKWLYKEKRIRDLMTKLRDMKITLLGILNTLQLDLQLTQLNIASESTIQRTTTEGDASLEYLEWKKLQEENAKANTPPSAHVGSKMGKMGFAVTNIKAFSQSSSVAPNSISTEATNVASRGLEDDTQSIMTIETFQTAVSFLPHEPENNNGKLDLFGACEPREKAWRVEMAGLARAHFGMSEVDATAWAEGLALPEVLNKVSEVDGDGANNVVDPGTGGTESSNLGRGEFLSPTSSAERLEDVAPNPKLLLFDELLRYPIKARKMRTRPRATMQQRKAREARRMEKEEVLAKEVAEHEAQLIEEERGSRVIYPKVSYRKTGWSGGSQQHDLGPATMRFMSGKKRTSEKKEGKGMEGDPSPSIWETPSSHHQRSRPPPTQISKTEHPIKSPRKLNKDEQPPFRRPNSYYGVDPSKSNPSYQQRSKYQFEADSGDENMDDDLPVADYYAAPNRERLKALAGEIASTNEDESRTQVLDRIADKSDNVDDQICVMDRLGTTPSQINDSQFDTVMLDWNSEDENAFNAIRCKAKDEDEDKEDGEGRKREYGHDFAYEVEEADDEEDAPGANVEKRETREAASLIAQPSFPSDVQLSRLWWQAYAKLDNGPSKALCIEHTYFDFMQSEYPVQDLTDDGEWATKTAEMAEKINNLQILMRNSPVPQDAELANCLLKVDEIMKVMKIVEGTLGYNTAALGWYSICAVVIKILGFQPTDVSTLSHIAEVAGLVARYAVMENIYHQWQGMTLKKDYEESLIDLCLLIFKYLVKASYVWRSEPLADSYRDELKVLFEGIQEADQKCRTFRVIVETDASTTKEVPDVLGSDVDDWDSDGVSTPTDLVDRIELPYLTSIVAQGSS